jgi:hypothetical protein
MIEAITGALITGIFTIIGAVIPVIILRMEPKEKTAIDKANADNSNAVHIKRIFTWQSLVGGFIGGFLGVAFATLILSGSFFFHSSAITNQPANNATSLPTINLTADTTALSITATLIPINALASHPIVTATLNVTRSFETTAEAVFTPRTPVSATIEISYLRLQGDRLMLFARSTSQNCLSFISGPHEESIPSFIKDGYSGPANIIQRGGFFLQNQPCNMNNETGWLTFQIDPSTFSLPGLYTFDLRAWIKLEDALAYSPLFPLISFEVP